VRTCKVCRQKYEPARAMQTTCSIPCAIGYGRTQLAKKQAKEAKAERAKDNAKRETLKTRSDWLKEAQQAFNKFVRLRDVGKGCISCAAPLCDGGVGGGFDAGHFRSVGSAPHLRFDERNVHGQCKRCNRWGSGMASGYRVGLLVLLGMDQVQALEADQTPRKWSIEELKALRDTYRAKAKALEATNASN
jgi:hypothetical protein